MKKARLVALQIHMLPTGQQLLNLNKEQLTKFITKHEKFWEVRFSRPEANLEKKFDFVINFKNEQAISSAC